MVSFKRGKKKNTTVSKPMDQHQSSTGHGVTVKTFDASSGKFLDSKPNIARVLIKELEVTRDDTGPQTPVF